MSRSNPALVMPLSIRVADALRATAIASLGEDAYRSDHRAVADRSDVKRSIAYLLRSVCGFTGIVEISELGHNLLSAARQAREAEAASPQHDYKLMRAKRFTWSETRPDGRVFDCVRMICGDFDSGVIVCERG